MVRASLSPPSGDARVAGPRSLWAAHPRAASEESSRGPELLLGRPEVVEPLGDGRGGTDRRATSVRKETGGGDSTVGRCSWGTVMATTAAVDDGVEPCRLRPTTPIRRVRSIRASASPQTGSRPAHRRRRCRADSKHQVTLTLAPGRTIVVTDRQRTAGSAPARSTPARPAGHRGDRSTRPGHPSGSGRHLVRASLGVVLAPVPQPAIGPGKGLEGSSGSAAGAVVRARGPGRCAAAPSPRPQPGEQQQQRKDQRNASARSLRKPATRSASRLPLQVVLLLSATKPASSMTIAQPTTSGSRRSGSLKHVPPIPGHPEACLGCVSGAPGGRSSPHYYRT